MTSPAGPLKRKARIWVDADACPSAAKEVLFRASKRTRTEVWLVANQVMGTPSASLVRMVQVAKGPDVADQFIAERVEPGDLVITADIPLAAATVEAGGTALNPRGEVYDDSNIGERLAVRDFMTDLREQGTETSGPPPYHERDKARFAAALDRYLAALRAEREASKSGEV